MPNKPSSAEERPNADDAVKPLSTEEQPRTAAAITRGGNKPVPTPEAGKQPIREPYGKAPGSGEDPSNPARKER
jgi:hypothetical protein